MRMPDLLATRNGRLAAFFSLYVTEGIPLGFTATAVATTMRREGVPVEDIGQFVGALYLPWAWKWAIGPFVDTLYVDRLGRRRMWIVLAQLGMALTLLAGMPLDLAADVGLFTTLIIVHNVFGATQDVAIDALAVNTLRDDERGTANGLMFAGAYVGQALGGAGVLFLMPYLGLRGSFVLVAAMVLTVTALVALPLREPRHKDADAPPEPNPIRAATREIAGFTVAAAKSFFSSRGALVAVFFALLPAGAYALSLSLMSNLAVELGMPDDEIAALSLAATIISALSCVAGGWISDRFGRRRMLALYLAGTAIPTLYLAWMMQQHAWVMPVDPTMADRPTVPAVLVTTFWIASLVYAVFQGLMYGTRSALFMDVTDPKVAATQFTAYMAMLNLVITYTSTWQGHALAAWGYPVTLSVDAGLGFLGIALLPFLTPTPRAEPAA